MTAQLYLKSASVLRACLVERDGSTTAAVFRVHELDAVRRLAGRYRCMAGLCGTHLKRYHNFDLFEKTIERERNAPRWVGGFSD